MTDFPTTNSFLDSLIETPVLATESSSDLQEAIPYEGMDPRLKLLSYSSCLTLHTCPRKYQLYKLNSLEADLEEELNSFQQLTFDFGTAVGDGIQSCLLGKSEDEIFLAIFLSWKGELLLENTKQKKSFWLALHAVRCFMDLKSTGYLEDYELVEYEGRPAVELSFEIELNGYKYRGFVDAVLKHKETGEILVLEAKTSSATNINAAQYKNSSQAIGYSVVLDKIFKEYSSYNVLYLVYNTKKLEYTELYFTKSLWQRALWLQNLMLDTIAIDNYESFGNYPMYGENCFSYYRECEYYNLCTLPTERLVKPFTIKARDRIEKDTERYEIKVSFDELVRSQLEK